MITVLSLNTFLLDIRLFGLVPLYPGAPHVEARLRALGDALRDERADVVCLQEVFRRPHRAWLAEALRDRYPWAAGVRHPGRPLGTGLMVLSRHPILEARPVEFRNAFFEERLVIRMGLLDCLIDLPDWGLVRVIDTHLVAGGLNHHPEAAEAEAMRARQVDELLAHLHHSGSETDLGTTIVAGDLNAGPQTSETNYRGLLEGGLRDAFAEFDAAAPPTHGNAMSWHPENPLITGELNASLPPQRIDHVLLRAAGAEGVVPVSAEIAFCAPRVQLSDGTKVPLSDHYGIRVGLDRRH